MEHEGRVFKVAEMAGRRINKVKVEDKVAKTGDGVAAPEMREDKAVS